MPTVHLALGSNLGDRESALRSALERLESPGLHLLRASRLYETEPVGFRDQPWFLNRVAEFACAWDPEALLARTQAVEQEMGRERSIPNGPRVIDIDIVLYGDLVHDRPNLSIPHPRFAQRRFVLEPLADLNPELRDPRTGETVANLLQAARQGTDQVRIFQSATS